MHFRPRPLRDGRVSLILIYATFERTHSQSRHLIRTAQYSPFIRAQRSSMKDVRFNDHVRVRKHAMTVGVNPACRNGPPVTLDWEVLDDTESTALSELELEQEQRYAEKKRTNRHPPIRRLCYYDRHLILIGAGCSSADIRQAVKTTRRERRQREWTQTVEKMKGKWKKLTSSRFKGCGSKHCGRRLRNCRFFAAARGATRASICRRHPRAKKATTKARTCTTGSPDSETELLRSATNFERCRLFAGRD